MKQLIYLIIFICTALHSVAQKELVLQNPDSLTRGKAARVDSVRPVTTAAKPAIVTDTTKKPFSPRKAILLSTFIPGAGQIYNKRYWEAPLAWAAVGIPISLFFYNNSWYKKTRDAYEEKFENNNPDLSKIDPLLRNLDVGSLQNYRNQFRRNRDFSVLWTLIMWGVNVADAAVFAHLKQFDVSDDLSLHLTPWADPQGKGFGVAISFTNKTRRVLTYR
jgi:TM2 domain-containing membrane protein YozV